jgi:hypothetical protein
MCVSHTAADDWPTATLVPMDAIAGLYIHEMAPNCLKQLGFPVTTSPAQAPAGQNRASEP